MYGNVVRFLVVSVALAAPALADEIGNAERGKEIFELCAGCHEVGRGAENGIGPHLNGLFGRNAGSVAEGFRYSEGLKRAGADGLVWHLDKLDAYLTHPKLLVSDTRMNFDGLEEPQDRADVLAYLRIYSDNPSNIPEADPTAIPAEVELPEDILALVGDAEYGEYLSSECKTCHQADGNDDGIPSITNWPQEDFVMAMHAYKRKIRPHPVMQMMAGRLSDEEIAALAAYFRDIE
ncbi:c-type cytochrome [Roseovarius sp. PS-C2]|uniref:c-type cytochrome n=1 Tax=Roseovarius sp. PS-C2 TaxID=2820814 RepID=UPI001C0AADD0|nr:c-type cytochrome [Roseovarius sp. PS-C2]MBU3259417.1 c-type cytochrome [Roseovarius sp. PS-C2]